MRSPLGRTLVVVALALMVLAVAIRGARLPEDVAARIDGRDLSVTVLDLFVAEARQHRPETGRAEVLAELVDTYLAGQWYRDEEEYRGEDWAVVSQDRVGYDRPTRIRNGVYALLRGVWPEPLSAALEARGWRHPRQALEIPPNLDKAALAPVLTLSGLALAPSPEQWRRAEQWIVARYRFDAEGMEQAVSLADLYRAQNIQMKVRFHNLDRPAMEGALYQYLTVAFVLHWFERHSGLDQKEQAWVWQLVGDREDYGALLRARGIHDDPHADNPELRRAAADIPGTEIQRYYQDHRDRFVRIEGVRAEALQLPSQDAADRLYQHLRQAEAPWDLWRTAMTRPRVKHQDLGWLRRSSGQGSGQNKGQDSWLLGLAFAQTDEGPAAPARQPGEQAGWWLLWVHERQTGFQPADSEAVRYEASYVLARERIRRDWDEELRRRREILPLRTNEGVIVCSEC